MRKCDVCQKGSMIQQSGAHQYGGGWAMRATKKRAVWMVNLHSAKVTFKGVRQTMRLCTKCLRRVKAAMPSSHSGAKRSEAIESKPLIVPKVKESPVATA